MEGYSLVNYMRKAKFRPPQERISEETRQIRSVCGLCNGGCGLLIKTTLEGRLLGVYGDPQNSWSEGHICPKPIESAQSLKSPARVTHPLKKERGFFKRITWEEALDYIAPKWSEAREQYGNAAVAAIVSKIGGSHSKLALNDFAELTGLNNYGTAPICYESERKIRSSLFGSAASPNPLSDATQAKLLLLVGNNLAQTKAGQFHWVKKAQSRGTKIIVIDVRFTETARQADQFIQVRPGTDAALGLALLNVIVNEGCYDQKIVAEYSTGFDNLAAAVAPYTPDWAAQETGLTPETIYNLAYDLRDLKPGLLYPGRGIVCVNNGSTALWCFEALMALLGNIGRAGGGIVSHIIDYGKTQGLIPTELLAKPERKYSAPELYQAMFNGDIKVLYIAGNPAATWPASQKMRQAISQVPLVISHTLFLDDTARLADVVLPATHWLEEAGAQASVNRVLQWREAAVAPPPEAKSAAVFLRLLAERLGLPLTYFPPDPASAWELERQHIPSVKGIDIHRLKQTAGGITYPCREGKLPECRLYGNYAFTTPSGKIELGKMPPYSHPLDAPGNSRRLVNEYPFFLNTVKVAYHYHTQNQYSPWAQKISSPCVEINSNLGRALGLREGERVKVETPFGFVILPLKLNPDVPPHCLFTQPYYSDEGVGFEPINSLFPTFTDPAGGNFIQKNIQCRLLRLE